MNKKIKKFVLIGSIFFIAASCNVFSNLGIVGVMKTLNAGGNWQQADAIVNSKSTISGSTVAEMGFDPQNRQNIYLASVNQGLWLSTDAAKTWKQALANISALDFAIDPVNNKNIFVSGIFNGHGRIVKTTDNAKTWTEEYEEASANNAVNTITINPVNPNELYAGLNSGVLIKSIDGGTNWFVVFDFNHAAGFNGTNNVNLNADNILKVRFNSVNNTLYVLLHNSGLAESTDGGVHWTFITTALTAETLNDLVALQPRKVDTFTKMALDDSVAGVIYLTTSNGLYKTSDDGKHWSFLNVPVQTNAQQPRAVASSKGGTLVYISIANTIFKSVDGGQSWETEELQTTNLVNKILIDPVLPQIVYSGLIPKQ